MLEGRYRKNAIGQADDALKPNGVAVMDFRQAEVAAREWAALQHQTAAGMDTGSGAPYTVALAVAAYIEAYRLRGGKERKAARCHSQRAYRPRVGACPARPPHAAAGREVARCASQCSAETADVP